MRKNAFVDATLGVIAIGLSASTAAISAYVSPAFRGYLYGLAVAWALVSVAQAVRAMRATRRHEVELDGIRAQQEWLAQPESYRQFQMIFEQHDAALAADARFTGNFDIDSRNAALTKVRCKTCGWEIQKALFYARQDALSHLTAFHPPIPQRRRFLARSN